MKKISILFSILITFGLFYNFAIAETNNKTTSKSIPVYKIEIVNPKPNDTFQNSAQSITMLVSVTPELEPEDNVIVLVDGNPVGEPIHSTSLDLPWLARGSHTLQAKIIQPKGRGAETEIMTIFQQRKSKLLP